MPVFKNAETLLLRDNDGKSLLQVHARLLGISYKDSGDQKVTIVATTEAGGGGVVVLEKKQIEVLIKFLTCYV
jgi:hypothetical protein